MLLKLPNRISARRDSLCLHPPYSTVKRRSSPKNRQKRQTGILQAIKDVYFARRQLKRPRRATRDNHAKP
jgi:hypothetical protein